MRKQNHLASFIVLSMMLVACSPFLDASSEVCQANDVKCLEGFPPNKHWAPYHSLNYDPLVLSANVTILADDMGNPWTSNGKRVAVIGKGENITDVFEKDGKVYLVKK